MKSHVADMFKIWSAALLDAAGACDVPLAELVPDMERVKRLIQTRGLGVFTLDLPDLDNNLLRLLEDGILPTGGPLARRTSNRDRRPSFLKALWSRVCDKEGCLYEKPCANSLFYIRQLSCFFKKVELPCSTPRTVAAVREYYAIERAIKPATMSWDDDSLDGMAPTFVEAFAHKVDQSQMRFDFIEDVASPDAAFLRRLDKVCGLISTALGYFDSLSDNDRSNGEFRHGPGSVSDNKRKSYKYEFPHWPKKLDTYFPFDWCGAPSILDVAPSASEPASKLIAVPKTAKGPRLIASEPTAHMWCQQKIYSWLDERMSNSFIGHFVSLHDQTASQQLVMEASVDRSLATIDLSSASDRISCAHIESLFRANLSLLRAIHSVRTRSVTDKVINEHGTQTLRKFAAMGSALTFPVQCIFFLSIALASAGAYDMRSILALRGKVRIFGDDIIVPNQSYVDVTRNLHDLGLKVNTSKSFSFGYFRESCGMDAWKGVDLTPCKPKVVVADAPQTYAALIDISNNLYCKGLWHAAEATVSNIPSRLKRVVVPIRCGVLALKSICGLDVSKAKLRYNKDLHVDQVLVPALTSKVEYRKPSTSAMLTQHFTSRHSWQKPRELGVAQNGVAKLAASWVDLPTLNLMPTQVSASQF